MCQACLAICGFDCRKSLLFVFLGLKGSRPSSLHPECGRFFFESVWRLFDKKDEDSCRRKTHSNVSPGKKGLVCCAFSLQAHAKKWQQSLDHFLMFQDRIRVFFFVFENGLCVPIGVTLFRRRTRKREIPKGKDFFKEDPGRAPERKLDI